MIAASLKIEVKLNKFETAGPAVRNKLGRIVKKACLDIEANAKDNAPVDTGALKASIYSVVDGADGAAEAEAEARAANSKINFVTPDGDVIVDRLHGMVVVGADYGPYVEYGTTRAGAQPFFTPAVEAVRGSFEGAARQLNDAVIAAAGKSAI